MAAALSNNRNRNHIDGCERKAFIQALLWTAEAVLDNKRGLLFAFLSKYLSATIQKQIEQALQLKSFHRKEAELALTEFL